MRWRVMKGTWLAWVLCLYFGSHPALAESTWWEIWQGIEHTENHLLAWGKHHLTWIPTAGESINRGSATQIQCVLPCDEGGGHWVVFEDGSWRHLTSGHWDGHWSDGHSNLRALSRDSPSGQEVFCWDGRELRLYHVQNQPLLQWRVELPGVVNPVLRKAGSMGEVWLGTGHKAILVGAEGILSDVDFAVVFQDYFEAGDDLLVLDSHSRLLLATGPRTGEDLLRAEVKRIFHGRDGQRVLLSSGELLLVRGNQFLPERTHPAGRGAQLEWADSTTHYWQAQDYKRVMQFQSGEWHETRVLDHGAAIRQRYFHGSAEWRLFQSGLLERRIAGQLTELGHWSGANKLVFAGPGPLLLTNDGVAGFLWSGTPLSFLNTRGNDLAALEDYVFLTGAEGLRIFWSAEEELWMQWESASGTGNRIAVSPRYCVIQQENMLELWDIQLPWNPRWQGVIPQNEELETFMVLEDRLIVGHESETTVYELSAQGIQLSRTPWVHYGARSYARRSVNRLLALNHKGVLRQMLLQNNQPVRIEWEQQLEMSGQLSVHGDSVYVLAEEGTGAWRLPALELNREFPQTRSARPALTLARGQSLNLASFGVNQPATAALYNLRGRRIRQWTMGAGNAPICQLNNCASGLYFMHFQGPGGIDLETRPVLLLP